MTAKKFLPPKAPFTLMDDGTVHTDGSIRRKITGTALGAVLAVNPWKTPFRVACELLGLIEEDISDKPAVKTGRILESKIIDYLKKTAKPGGEFYSADQLFEERKGPHDQWPSDFDDEIFAGHLDGMVVIGGVDYVLEVKTARDLTGWVGGIPEHYLWQVRLYNQHTCMQNDAYVALGIVSEETYKDPASWTPEGNVALFKVDLNEKETSRGLVQAREWYGAYIKNGTTPPYNPNDPRDVEVWEYLKSVAQTEESVESALDELVRLEAEVKAHDAEVQDKRDRIEALRQSIRDNLSANGRKEVVSGGWKGILGTTTRKSIDEEAMIADGLDPKKYIKTTTSNTFRLKEIKEE